MRKLSLYIFSILSSAFLFDYSHFFKFFQTCKSSSSFQIKSAFEFGTSDMRVRFEILVE